MRIAAGDAPGQKLLYEGPSKNRAMASFRRPPSDEQREVTSVPLSRLDAIVPTAEAPRVRLVKIDVEGYELPVLRGLEGVFRAGGRPVVVTEVTPKWDVAEEASYVRWLSKHYRLNVYRLAREGLLSGRRVPATPSLEVETVSAKQSELLLVPEEVARETRGHPTL
jgi:hypothetical protein